MSFVGFTYGHCQACVHSTWPGCASLLPLRENAAGEAGRMRGRFQASQDPSRGSPMLATLSRKRRGDAPFAVRLCAFLVLLLLAPPITVAAARPLQIVALGDSLTAGLGLPADESFPAVLQKTLRAKGYDVEVINAGVSGDTTAAGLARFDWSAPDGVDAAIVELGANDMLRGLDPAAAEKNLGEILGKLRARHVPTLLAGMRAAPNLGADYRARFDAIYPDLARQYDVALYPFFLDGVAADPKLNQPDGLHPTKTGVEVIVARILPDVEALIAKAKQ
jgi:acyl-CoA thioesterase I